MAVTDAFSAQIVALVRHMPDEAILALVKHQLGVFGAGPVTLPLVVNGRGGNGSPRAVAAAPGKAKRGGAAKRRPGRSRAVAPSADRREMLASVERVVHASTGVSASDVARAAGIAQTRAAAALKELKLEKRIFQGGDRRFARYAGDARTAEQASLTARQTATGPTPAKKPHPRKRNGAG